MRCAWLMAAMHGGVWRQAYGAVVGGLFGDAGN
jgi:hypothetical protein